MIVVDTSVWIAYFNKVHNDSVAKLKAVDDFGHILVGDLVLLEVLQGARDERHAARLEQELRVFAPAGLLDDEIAVRAAQNYRILRGLGWTIRTSADLIIATFCLVEGHELLHDDRDFSPVRTAPRASLPIERPEKRTPAEAASSKISARPAPARARRRDRPGRSWCG